MEYLFTKEQLMRFAKFCVENNCASDVNYRHWIDKEEQQVNNLNIPAVINCVPYQICPKCVGDGDLFRHNSPAIMGTNARPICDVCEGKKIIPMAHCL